MKGEKLLTILEYIKEVGETAGDLLCVIATAPYGSSFGRMEYRLNQLQKERRERQFTAREKQNFYLVLSRLRKDELIETKVKNKKRFFSITRRGIEKLKELRKRRESALPAKTKYQAEKDKELKIIAFDIPETQRKKRDWVRLVLRRLGFTMLQKSLWIGKVGIPEEFIFDLRRYRLLSYIEILAVTKTGTIRPITLNDREK